MLWVSAEYETQIRRAVIEYVQFLFNQGFGPPICIFVCLIGVLGTWLVAPDTRRPSRNSFDRDDVFPQVGVWGEQTTDVDTVLQPLLNRFWNTVGNRASPAYDASGRWVGYK
jgi:hypothetical protein